MCYNVYFRVSTVLKKHESGLLLVLGFGGFSLLLAFLYNAMRKYIFHDEHNLDSTFDAGGNVTFSLTAVTVASQLFWPGDILHSATLTVKVDNSGLSYQTTPVFSYIHWYLTISNKNESERTMHRFIYLFIWIWFYAMMKTISRIEPWSVLWWTESRYCSDETPQTPMRVTSRPSHAVLEEASKCWTWTHSGIVNEMPLWPLSGHAYSFC